MARSIDARAMRRMNRASVLRKIFDADTISRVQIARDMGMNKATVSSIVDDLIQEQIVNETGYGDSQGGRKPVLLELNGQAAYIISIDVQITHITTAVVSLKSEIAWRRENLLYRAGERPTRDDFIRKLEEAIKTAMENVPSSPHGVLGVGVALPGMVNARTGYVHYLPNLEIEDWALRAELERRVKVPIFMDNDANCGALAEHSRSKTSHLVFVNAGIGVGVGIVADGQLYHGKDGIAGEYGHTTISAMGIRCSCGSYGCWEEYASERGLLRIVQDRGRALNTKVPDADFVPSCISSADAGDEAFLEGFTELGRNLGYGIANVCNALNPEKVILGGSIANAYPFIYQSMMQVLRQRAISKNKQMELERAPDGAVVLGAARLVMLAVLLNAQNPLPQLMGQAARKQDTRNMK